MVGQYVQPTPLFRFFSRHIMVSILSDNFTVIRQFLFFYIFSSGDLFWGLLLFSTVYFFGVHQPTRFFFLLRSIGYSCRGYPILSLDWSCLRSRRHSFLPFTNIFRHSFKWMVLKYPLLSDLYRPLNISGSPSVSQKVF